MNERWKDIPDTDGHYQISSYGRVRSCISLGSHKRTDTWRIRRPSKSGVYDNLTYSKKLDNGESQRVSNSVHRLVWLAFCSEVPAGYEIDHIDRNKKNNCLHNLRLVTTQQNQANQCLRTTCNGKPKSSKYRGVTWDATRKKWRAGIQIFGKSYNLGRFLSEDAAALAYNAAALKYFEEYANINVV